MVMKIKLMFAFVIREICHMAHSEKKITNITLVLWYFPIYAN